MHTLSSARRTCIASASAVEWTATVAMPSSLAARRMRSAISPRLAIRILSNMRRRSLDHEEGLAELDRLPVLDEDRRHRAGAGRHDLVEGLHRLDEQKLLAILDPRAHLDEHLGVRGWPAIGSAHHRREHCARMSCAGPA